MDDKSNAWGGYSTTYRGDYLNDNITGISGTNTTKNIYFAFAQTSSFIKIKSSGFTALSPLAMAFPASILPYDSDDTDGAYLLIVTLPTHMMP